MEARLCERAEWGEAIQRADAVRWVDRVAVIVRPDRVPTELLVSPIARGGRDHDGDGKWVAKLRLGLAAPEGMSPIDPETYAGNFAAAIRRRSTTQ